MSCIFPLWECFFVFQSHIISRALTIIIVHYAEQNKSGILALDKHSRAYYNTVEQSLNYLTKERTTLAESEMKCACEVIHEDTVREVERKLSDKDEYIELASLFKMFGDGTRVQILHALELHEMCVCDLAALLGITKSAVSHQLKALKLANLVKFRREGQVVYYSLADDHVNAILDIGFEHIREK